MLILVHRITQFTLICSYSKSASIYALSRKSFEETALKFLQLDDSGALKSYLSCKLDALSERDVTQVTLLVLWLLEIMLDQMGKLRSKGETSSEEYQILLAEFRSLFNERRIKVIIFIDNIFLWPFINCFFRQACVKRNLKVVRELISSHGDEENLVHFAQEMEDYRVVVEHLLQRKRFKEALDVLKDEVSDYFHLFKAVMECSPLAEKYRSSL